MTDDRYAAKVRAFHEVCDIPLDHDITKEALLLERRLQLIEEEVRELREAAAHLSAAPNKEHYAHLLRELADVQYVVSGMAVTFGLPLADAFDRVHEANLSKLVNGKALKSETGKVIKGPDFKPPVLVDLCPESTN